MLNPYLKGAKARTLREHSAGVRVGRRAWGAAWVAQPSATPQGAGTARGGVLAGNYAGASPLEQAEPAEGASVGVSVRELDEGAGQGAEQGRQQGAPLAAAALAAVASPPPFSPPTSLAARTPLGPAPGSGSAAASPFLSPRMPHSRLRPAVSASLTAPPLASLDAQPGSEAGNAWATDNPLLQRR